MVGYKIYYGGSSGVYTNDIYVTGSTTGTITGLSAGATYYFSATAVSPAGEESIFSNETSYHAPILNTNPPTLNAITNLTINENSGLQMVTLTGITFGSNYGPQTLTVSATSSNLSIITAPIVSYTSPNSTGTLTFAPVTNAFGTATVTVTVNNGDITNNITTRTFTVTVNPVSQPPTLSPISNVSIIEGTTSQSINLTGISSGLPTNSTVKIGAKSSTLTIISAATIKYTSPASTALLTLTAKSSVLGTATITVTVTNAAKTNNIFTRTFTATIIPVPPPTLNPISNLVVAANAGMQTVNLTGISSGAPPTNQLLKVTAIANNMQLISSPAIQYTSPSSTGLLTFRPAGKNITGSSTITVTVTDTNQSNNTFSRQFTVTVIAPVTNTVASLTSANRANGQFNFQVTGMPGGKYVVQGSTDMIHWVPLQTNNAPFGFQDNVSNGLPQRFYRAVFSQ